MQIAIERLLRGETLPIPIELTGRTLYHRTPTGIDPTPLVVLGALEDATDWYVLVKPDSQITVVRNDTLVDQKPSVIQHLLKGFRMVYEEYPILLAPYGICFVATIACLLDTFGIHLDFARILP